MHNLKVIGKTRVNFDLITFKEIKIDRQRIKDAVQDFLLKSNIDSLPIDVITLAKDNNWIVISYAQCPDVIKKEYEEIMYTNWGFTILYKNNYIIFYNNKINLNLQRLTIAHEIGHIVLNHFQEFDPITQEKEANYFAVNLLAPMCILYICGAYTKNDIVSLCGIGHNVADKLSQKMIQKNYINLTNKEIKILEKFDNFIKNYKNRQDFTKVYKNPSI